MVKLIGIIVAFALAVCAVVFIFSGQSVSPFEIEAEAEGIRVLVRRGPIVNFIITINDRWKSKSANLQKGSTLIPWNQFEGDAPIRDFIDLQSWRASVTGELNNRPFDSVVAFQQIDSGSATSQVIHYAKPKR